MVGLSAGAPPRFGVVALWCPRVALLMSAMSLSARRAETDDDSQPPGRVHTHFAGFSTGLSESVGEYSAVSALSAPHRSMQRRVGTPWKCAPRWVPSRSLRRGQTRQSRGADEILPASPRSLVHFGDSRRRPRPRPM